MEKIYILCNNCTLITTEIIGDGLLYEPNFIQLSKVSINLIKNSLHVIMILNTNYKILYTYDKQRIIIKISKIAAFEKNKII